MPVEGFFTRQQAGRPKKSDHELSTDTLKRLGPGAVKLMNPQAKHPNMDATGSKKPEVYVLGEAPGEEEDLQGKQFVGRSGQLLRMNLPEEYEYVTRFNNCVQTRPPDNRTPTSIEVEAFRSKVEEDIAATKPKVILATGNVPLSWCLGKVKGVAIKNARGRKFPVRIRDHECWVVPIWHPAYLIRMIGSPVKISNAALRDVKEKKARQEAPIWARDIQFAYDLASSEDLPVVLTEEEAKQDIEIFLADQTVEGFRPLKRRINQTLESGKFAFDFETTHLRPYFKDSKIVSVAITDEHGTYGFCVDHPKQDWGPNKPTLKAWMDALAFSDCKKIAHNLPFDLEWWVKMAGPQAAFCGQWDCTMGQAFVLDERRGAHNLNFLTKLHFGIQVKKLTDVNRAMPQASDPKDLLLYNCLDAKLTWMLEKRQRKIIKAQGQKTFQTYELHRDGMIPIVIAQYKGVCVDQSEVKRQEAKFRKQLDEVSKTIMQSPEVLRYQKRYGPFNPASPQDLTKMFRDLLGCHQGYPKNKDGEYNTDSKSYSTDEDTLKEIGTDLALKVVHRRKLTKILSTYVTCLLKGSENSVIYPDDKVHTQFNCNQAETARLSSEGPNMQNQQKRSEEGRQIRRCFIPGVGEVFVAIDYGQIEYRVIGMASHDKVVCNSCFSDYDVHMEWAKRINAACPQVMQRRYGHLEEAKAFKAFRGDVKNQWVFPKFFGSSPASVARNLDNIPLSIAQELSDEFWDFFSGVHEWQKEVVKFYSKYGYVEFLTGRRRHGPLSYNMIINTPIQGTAAEIIRKAWITIVQFASQKQDLDLAPNLQIHDDLTGSTPEYKAEYMIKAWSRRMLTVDFPFINVPLSVEVSVGRNWKDMKEVARFRSDKIEAIKDFKLEIAA